VNFTQSFKLAINSLRTSKVRALLTMLGIIIGVAAVIVIISLGNGLTGMVEQQVEKVGVNQMYVYDWGRGDGSLKFGPDRMMELVESRPDVFSGLSPWVTASAPVRKMNGDDMKKTNVYGISEAMYNQATGRTLDGDALAKGRYLRYVDVETRQNVCVIGAYVEQAAFQGDALGKSLLVGGIPYTVVGVLAQAGAVMEEGGSDDQLFIPYENALQLNGTRDVQLYQVTAQSRELVTEAKGLFMDALQRFYNYEDAFYNAYYIQTMAEQVAMINGMMGIAMAVLVAIAAISLLVGGIGIMNIMLVSVTERTREIGIRKSLGAKRKDIRRQFVIEAGTTSALGGLLGIGLGFLLSTGLGAVFGSMLVDSITGGDAGGITFNATPDVTAVAVSFGVSVAIGVLFGYLPANKAAKLNPIDALRYE